MAIDDQLSQLRRQLSGYARAVSGSSDEAEDLVHDAIVRALASMSTPTKIDDLRPWMFRIIRNLNVDNRRRAKVRTEYAAHHARLLNDAPAETHDPLTSLLVRQAMESLSQDHREVLFLVDVMGMRYAEAAQVLGVAEGTIMSRVSRGRRALLDRLDETNVAQLHRRRQRN